MLQIKYIRENKEEAIRLLSIRQNDAKSKIEWVLEFDKKYRKGKSEFDSLLHESSKISQEVHQLLKNGKIEEAESLKKRGVDLKNKAEELEEEIKIIEQELIYSLTAIPNIPNGQVPVGSSSSDNLIVKEEFFPVVLHPDSRPHWELAKQYDLIDFELGSKIAGAGFPVYKGRGAKLQRALINFFLDKAILAGYNEVQLPILVNKDSVYGTGQFPDKQGQMYYVEKDELYLIPTAEVPITNLYRDVIIKEENLPIKNCGYTPCFRREAGTYGKDVRGLNRLHQFDKVEIVQVSHPDKSYEILEDMKHHVSNLLMELELPYRIVLLCGGDLSFSSAMTFDFETYSAAQDKWLEVSSVSNFETFQSNRLKLRFKDKSGKIQLAHTLNGSALALPRILACLLENNQTPDGIRIPKALVPYTGFHLIS